MQLDRTSIQRGDFPKSRGGYDPQAVDEHLRQIADAVAAMPAQAPVATGVSEQIHSIVAAAETAASEIVSRARESASRAGEDAAARARSEGTRAAAALDALRARIDAVDGEVDELLASLRLRAEAIGAAMAELGTADGAVASSPAPGPAPATPVAEPSPPPTSASPPTTVPAAAAGANDDDAALADARLVALDMALGGSSRAEIDAYLAEHFELTDRSRLLDAVVAAAGA